MTIITIQESSIAKYEGLATIKRFQVVHWHFASSSIWLASSDFVIFFRKHILTCIFSPLLFFVTNFPLGIIAVETIYLLYVIIYFIANSELDRDRMFRQCQMKHMQ